MVDCREHLDLAAAAVREAGGGPIRVCLDVDAGWWPLRGRIRIGARRSPVRTPEQAAALAREVLARPELHLDGLMSYEAHIAGVGDRPPGRPLMGAAIRAMQRASARELAGRRAAVVEAVSAVAPLRFVNGGGTGLGRAHRRRAGGDRGRGGLRALRPDAVRRLRRASARSPAALFALPVVRRPDARTATAARRRLPGLGRGGRRPPAAPRTCPPGLRLDKPGGRGRGPDAAARAGRRGVARRRWGVDAARQGGRAVRAVRRGCIWCAAAELVERCRRIAARARLPVARGLNVQGIGRMDAG